MKKPTLSINEDDMYAVVIACEAVLRWSKHRTVASLLDYLEEREIVIALRDDINWKRNEIRNVRLVAAKMRAALVAHGYGKSLAKKRRESSF